MVKSKSNNVTAKMYDTLVRPVITEKSMVSSEAGKVVFIIYGTFICNERQR